MNNGQEQSTLYGGTMDGTVDYNEENSNINTSQGVDSIGEYSEQFETIIGLQEQQLTMMAQTNTNQLFVIGTFSGVFVLLLLYFVIKKFL